MGNLSIRWEDWKNAGTVVVPAPALIGCDEFQLAIPRRVGLHQSPLLLHQLGPGCAIVVLPVELFPANGEQCLNCLSHPRGQAPGPPGAPGVGALGWECATA